MPSGTFFNFPSELVGLSVLFKVRFESKSKCADVQLAEDTSWISSLKRNLHEKHPPTTLPKYISVLFHG